MRLSPFPIASVLALFAVPVTATVIGHMTPPPPLTTDRIGTLPATVRGAWRAYVARSVAAMARDKAMLAAERQPGAPVPASPPGAKGHRDTMPLDRDPAWYAGAEARAVADNIVSFQTPSGGWGKNQDRSGPPRAPGQMYLPFDSLAAKYATQDLAGGWSFVGTLDNDATTTELSFLARAQAARPGAEGEEYRAAFTKGVRYLLEAELPGGGWPQVYPLQGSYHDALTFNDDAALHAIELLQQVGEGRSDYAFVAAPIRQAARDAAARGIATLLATQVVVDGRRTIWAQQYDPLTRQPVGARNFEPIALATGESAAILRFLMRQPHPSPAIRQAVTDGAAWFAAHSLRDVAWAPASGPDGRRLVSQPGAGPIWARFYDIATSKPVFGDRDRSIHDDVNEISLERRIGYAWFGNSGTSVADAYGEWAGHAG
jgi:PelA/Pel-15E family pectate lyase